MTRDDPSLPPLVDLLPHRPPMRLLDRVVERDEHRTVCEAVVRETIAFSAIDGLVPVWIGLEYMAQCIAVHAGLRARAKGQPPPVGFFIGSRRVDFHADGFVPGEVLRVVAEHVWGAAELGSFACRLVDAATGAIAAQGVLKVFAPADIESFMTGASR